MRECKYGYRHDYSQNLNTSDFICPCGHVRTGEQNGYMKSWQFYTYKPEFLLKKFGLEMKPWVNDAD